MSDATCDGPAAVVGGHAYTCTCKRRCDGCAACRPDPAEAERERRDVETWYYSRVGTLTISFGDAHIYLNHMEQVDEQLTRSPVAPPALTLADPVRDIDDFTFDHVELYGYAPHPALRGEVAV